jgi:hypothetical protein
MFLIVTEAVTTTIRTFTQITELFDRLLFRRRTDPPTKI